MKIKWVEPTIDQRMAEYTDSRRLEVNFTHLVKRAPRIECETLTEYVKRLKLLAKCGY
jgi:hypothetical protein